jgi:fucose 4-O-acetylase-like acetyltransferase
MWFRRYEQAINRITRGYLKTLGEASLYVYGVHGIMVFIVLVALPDYYGYFLSTIITVIGLAILYIAARYRAVPRHYLAKLLKLS